MQTNLNFRSYTTTVVSSDRDHLGGGYRKRRKKIGENEGKEEQRKEQRKFK
jgi:hypothetical protein